MTTGTTPAPGTTQRRLGPDERRQQLIDTGLALVMSGPLDQVTAPAVAKSAGVSKGLVFHYFPTQRELQAAIARAAADQLLTMFAGTDADLSYEERLEAGLEAFVSFIEQQPASYAAIASGSGSDELLQQVFEDTREGVVDIIAGVIGIADLTPRGRLYLRGWIAMVEEMILQWILTRAITREELVSFLTQAAFDTIGKDRVR